MFKITSPGVYNTHLRNLNLNLDNFLDLRVCGLQMQLPLQRQRRSLGVDQKLLLGLRRPPSRVRWVFPKPLSCIHCAPPYLQCTFPVQLLDLQFGDLQNIFCLTRGGGQSIQGGSLFPLRIFELPSRALSCKGVGTHTKGQWHLQHLDCGDCDVVGLICCKNVTVVAKRLCLWLTS
jgi:hypothetical protein